MMRILRILVVAFTFVIIQGAITACSDSFSYTIDGLIVQNLANEAVTSALDIKKSEYGIRLNLLNHKHNSIGAYSANNAGAAYDCFPEYPHNKITDFKINALEPGTGISANVTDGFIGIVRDDSEYSDYVPVSELISHLNYQRF